MQGSSLPVSIQHSSLEAVERLVDSAQQLVVDHLQLASLEVRETVRATLGGALLGLLGVLLLTFSWGALMLWAYWLLADSLSPPTCVIGLGAVNLAVSVLVIGAGLRLIRRPEKESSRELP